MPQSESSPIRVLDRVETRPARGGATGALRRLDAILTRGMAAARERFGPDASTDPFRGLYISPEQAATALDVPAGTPLLAAIEGGPAALEDDLPAWADIADDDPGWGWLRTTYGLSDQELDIVLIALGPEVDPRYERVYGYLQDDVTRRRPSVNLALDLVTTTVDGKVAGRGAFGVGGALLGGRLLTLVAPPEVVEPTLLTHIVVPDEQVVDVLLGQAGIPRGLARWCRLARPGSADWSSTPLSAAEQNALVAAVRSAWTARRPLRLHFRGPRGSGRRAAAEALGAELAVPVLHVDVWDVADRSVAEEILCRAFREATLHGALVHLDDVDSLTADPRNREALLARLAAHPGVVILGGASSWASGEAPLGVVEVPFSPPGFEVRREAWTRSLEDAGVHLPAEVVESLAGRFRFGPGHVADTVATAVADAGRRAVSRQLQTATGLPAVAPVPTTDELVAAGRAQTRDHLAALTRTVEPLYTWSDLVLPEDSLAALHELCQRVGLADRVWRVWGFRGKFSSGRGATALFTGPPGTGKTMAAEVIARELGLDLFAIDLSSVISKYIGETEKNLERIFTAAAEAYAVLLFDEADALFGKRSEVRDAHDRYANVETSYLLQRMEQYDGIAILTTNLRAHLDPAFVRRLQFIVDFPFPDEDNRRRIWQGCFPADAPREENIDFARLGREYRLSGGSIKSAVLHAAFLAADEGVPIGMPHLLRAVRREHQKAGTVLPDPETDEG